MSSHKTGERNNSPHSNFVSECGHVPQGITVPQGATFPACPTCGNTKWKPRDGGAFGGGGGGAFG